MGRDRSTVANTLRLLRLPREVRELLGAGRLDAGHARALLALDRAEDQVALGARGRAQGPLRARGGAAGGAPARPAGAGAGPGADANTRAAEERLRAALGTRVEIARRGKGGALRIAFASEAELNRLFELLVRRRPRRGRSLSATRVASVETAGPSARRRGGLREAG